MNKSTINNKLANELFSNNYSKVIEAIHTIAESGNSSYLPALISLLQSNTNEEVKQSILKLLAEIKHSDAVPVLVNAIEDTKLLSVREDLLRACWENGLDYSNYFSTFIHVLIHGEYMEAFEAYTVIDSTEGTISETSMQEYLSTLKDALTDAAEDRQVLMHHLIQFLPSIVKQ